MITEPEVREALTHVMDPELGRSIIDLGMVPEIEIQAGRVTVTLALTTAACPLKHRMSDDIIAAVKSLDPHQDVSVKLTEMSAHQKAQIMAEALPDQERRPAAMLNHVSHVVAVMSGKGGVGKSTVSAMLAAALRRTGLKVALLDADITGPSIPKMLGVHAPPGMSPFGIVPPTTAGGIAVMSVNLLLPDENQAVIWRGPLISGAIRQFWDEVVWGTIDVMIVDLPPGTSDAALTVMQSLPLDGVLMVTSPQDLAGMVVRKAAQMAQKLSVPILGLIENMSAFTCPHCGQECAIFGPSHAQEVAGKLGTELLGRLPLDPQMASIADAGGMEDYVNDSMGHAVSELLRALNL